MASPATQPETTELPASSDSGNAVSHPSATTSTMKQHDEASPPSNGEQQEANTIATSVQHNSGSTAEAAMHLASPTGNEEGTLRGANNSSSTDDVSKLESGENNAGLPAQTAVPAASTHDVGDTDSKSSPSTKDGPITTVTSTSSGERQSQEKDDQVTLELLLLSGSRRRFTFKTSTTVNEVLAWTFKEWPSEWEEQKPKELSQLRLLYRGQFLDGSSKLSTHAAEDSAATVMHLTIRPAEANESLKPKRTKPASDKAAATDSHSGGCCSSCTIM